MVIERDYQELKRHSLKVRDHFFAEPQGEYILGDAILQFVFYGISVSLSVCLSVCLSAYLANYPVGSIIFVFPSAKVGLVR